MARYNVSVDLALVGPACDREIIDMIMGLPVGVQRGLSLWSWALGSYGPFT